MKTNLLKEYCKLGAALAKERLAIQARLQEIEAVLNGAQARKAEKAAAPAKAKGKRKMSAAGRAAIAAAAKARWAKERAAKAKAKKPAKAAK